MSADAPRVWFVIEQSGAFESVADHPAVQAYLERTYMLPALYQDEGGEG